MFTLNCKGRLLVAEKPLVMGIINLTPDSFYEGSRFSLMDEVLKQAEKMIREGADLLDIGGQSTHPGAEQVGVSEELQRVIESIRSIHNHFPEAVLSIDTYSSKVALEAIAAGASMVNDVSGGNMDASMLKVVGGLNVPYVCMHMKGDPLTMQKEAVYEDVTLEVLDYFIEKKAACIKAGIKDLILDPGFGFAKTSRHNFELLRKLSVFRMLDCPILLGLSRKATIYKTLGIGPGEALNGTTVMNTVGLMQGAQILRVHDVREAKEAVELVTAMRAT
ncbi:MAG TPA: dihydropteroate synthase [Puia sp.]|nr:dihydropteroate synthase [Puia sp.]